MIPYRRSIYINADEFIDVQWKTCGVHKAQRTAQRVSHQGDIAPLEMLDNATDQSDSVPEKVILHSRWVVGGFSVSRQVNAKIGKFLRQQWNETVKGPAIVLPPVQAEDRLSFSCAPPFTSYDSPGHRYLYFLPAIIIVSILNVLLGGTNMLSLVFKFICQLRTDTPLTNYPD